MRKGLKRQGMIGDHSDVDPGNFVTNPDQDSRIRTTDLWIRIRIRILRFSSIAEQCQQKISFFSSKF